jgi:lipid-binding SYLF domain-containing protein
MPRIFPSLAIALALAGALATSGTAVAASEPEKHVTMAQTTLSNFLRDPNMSWLQANLSRVKGLMIIPKVVKAGFVLGGSGGRGVLLARDATSGKWVGPAFYSVGTASVGFQAGVEVSEVVMMIMTEKGMNSLLATSAKLGGDASVAAGPVGIGANATVTEDVIAFTRSKGLYGGLNVDGSIIKTADDWNEGYYGKPVLPPEILLKGAVHNMQADKLIRMVTDATTPRQ